MAGASGGNYLRECLAASGLVLQAPPVPNEMRSDAVITIATIKRTLQQHYDFPRNATDLFRDFRDECEDQAVLRHYVFPNVVRLDSDGGVRPISDSVLKLLLSVPPLQDQLSEYVFERAIDFAVEGSCGPWIKTILRCFSTLDHIASPEKMATNIVNLLDVVTEKQIRLEIISAIPDIVGDCEHDNVAAELSRFLSEDGDLIPAVLDCLSYLCLSDERYRELQNKAISILRTSVQFDYFPNFVKFLLMPGRMDESGYLETVQGLRTALSWKGESSEISSSQILTASAIRSSITASKVISTAWFKSVQTCKIASDHKPLDVIILLILYTTADDKQRLVENILRKHIKLDILKEHLLDEAFKNFKPIFKHYLQNMLELVNSILKLKTDNLVVSFASHLYISMFSELADSRQQIVVDLLQQGLSCKQSMPGMLFILKTIANNDITMLKPHSLQMLILLDKLDDLNIGEVREIMNILCGLAYSLENSVIRDDMHIIIRKQLGCSNPAIKIKGILASVQAVKYLMKTQETGDDDVERSEDISYSSYGHLADGDTREAAQVIELICRSVKQVPDLYGFFYDELFEVLQSATYINASFLSWLTDAVTNDLQQNFIVSEIPLGKKQNLVYSMQYPLNDEDELDSVIAINIAELSLRTSNEDGADISVLPSLIQLVQITHAKKNNGDLSDIDALLGCPVIMPKFVLENCTEDLEDSQLFCILNCLIHCTNWFRELVNGFATQTNTNLKQKVMHRIENIEDIERSISTILQNTKFPFKPPMSTFDVSKYIGRHRENKVLKTLPTKATVPKKHKLNDTSINPTMKSLVSQSYPNNIDVKVKASIMEEIPLRKLHLNIMILLNDDLVIDDDQSGSLDLRSFKFILKYVNQRASAVMVSRIKKSTHLSRSDNVYDPKKAETVANQLFNLLPKLMLHLEDIKKGINNTFKGNDEDLSIAYTLPFIELQTSLEYLLHTFSIYFNWMEFRKQQQSLLKSSLRSVICKPEDKPTKVTSLRELLSNAAKMFQKLEGYCLLVPTAVQLIEVIKALSEITENETIFKILKEMSKNFLSKLWKSSEGSVEKGLVFNQYVNLVMEIYFVNPEIGEMKSLTFQIKGEILKLTGRNDNLDTLKCISKSNFPILYRNLIGALLDSAKSELNKDLTDRKQLDLWKDIAKLLKTIAEIAKILENRNNLSAFLKKSQPVLKLFLSHGMPMLEIKLKTESQSVIEIFKEFQYTTKFLQSLCCHSRLKKDSTLMAKVPQVRHLLERFIYKVKAALAANNCSEAFWMGNLKNRNIKGEEIPSQESMNDEENGDDSDDQLPEDNEDDSEDDEEMLNPESKSISDIN